jgi:hypothetical protein
MNNSIKNKVNIQVYAEKYLIYYGGFHYGCLKTIFINFNYKQFNF